jgi:hypothetical protein
VGRVDFQELVEPRDGKNFADSRPDVRQGKPTTALPQVTVQGNEFAQSGTGEVFNRLQVNDEVLPGVLLDELAELLIDHLDVLFVQALAAN